MFSNPGSFDKKILVTFPWGSRLSGVSNESNVAWYSRKIEIPANWDGKKVFLIFGASDWKTTVWLDGQQLGTYQGGYTPFEFDITSYLKIGQPQILVVKVDDIPHPFKLEGKQGYGEAKGIWQTVYMEARGQVSLKYIHFTPDIDKSLVEVRAVLNTAAPADVNLKIDFINGSQPNPQVLQKVTKGTSEILFQVPIEKMHLWDLNDPFLYDVQVSLIDKNRGNDKVTTYFGMRTVSVMHIPDLSYPYIQLNNKPVSLKWT